MLYQQSDVAASEDLDDASDRSFSYNTNSENAPLITNLYGAGDCMLTFCKIFSAFTSICLFCSFLASLFALVVQTTIEEVLNRPIYMILQLYCIGFNCIAFLCEMELTEGIRNIQVLQSWTVRGIFYIFVSFFTLQETNSTEYVKGDFINWFSRRAACSILLCGTVYIILGMLCLKKVRDRKMAKYIQLLAQYEIQQTLISRS
mmetsp:Transcript_28929/g.41250  ORF Transcript_28929/g.41250 Transcript_28929/m.41250 type:complete len:203 (+) Transcript_28929:3-611(+)